MNLFAELGALRQMPPSDLAIQKKIGALQKFITDNYYTCTTETLRSLGRMHVSVERFLHNIAIANGEGTAGD